MRISRDALEVDVPPGWEARITRRPAEDGATSNAVLHAANFALPRDRGDFGSGAVDRMGPEHIFVSLFEYDPEAADTAMFRNKARPRVRPSDFDTDRLQRALPGQSGCQYFFAEHARAFCLYVVLGSHARRAALVPRVARLLEGLSIGRRPVL